MWFCSGGCYLHLSELLHRHWGNLSWILQQLMTLWKQNKTGSTFIECTVIGVRQSPRHYNDVIMTTIAYQITSLTVVYSTVYSDANQRKHQSSTSLAFVWGIHRDRWIPRTKGQLRGKCFHLMTSSWNAVRFRYNVVLEYPPKKLPNRSPVRASYGLSFAGSKCSDLCDAWDTLVLYKKSSTTLIFPDKPQTNLIQMCCWLQNDGVHQSNTILRHRTILTTPLLQNDRSMFNLLILNSWSKRFGKSSASHKNGYKIPRFTSHLLWCAINTNYKTSWQSCFTELLCLPHQIILWSGYDFTFDKTFTCLCFVAAKLVCATRPTVTDRGFPECGCGSRWCVLLWWSIFTLTISLACTHIIQGYSTIYSTFSKVHG